MKTLLKIILTLLKRPFDQELNFFLLLYFLISFVNILNRTYYLSIISGIYWGIIGFVECYLCCFFLSFLKGKLRSSIKLLLVVMGLINMLSDIVVSFISESTFDGFVGLILGTNMNEFVEFCEHYVTIDMLLASVFSIFFLLVLFKCLYKIKKRDIYSKIGVLILLCCIPLLSKGHWHTTYPNIFVGKILLISKECQSNSCNLKDYYKNPKIDVLTDLPDNVVVIIGESFAKDFSSLYGYDKQTNPKLESLVGDKSLMVFNNVTSGSTTTIENLKMIMSTYSTRFSDKLWYEFQTLPEILNIIGYKTYWVSNQAEIGLYDNIPTKFARLCDSTLFISQNRYGIMGAASCDEEILEPFNRFLNGDSAKKVIFIHLMGSHPNYNCRYPDNFGKFLEDDYLNFRKEQRAIRSQYDNSILYNDSVIYQVLAKLEKKEALAFYFSDHGLDHFVTENDYSGHAKANKKSETVAKRIPFLVYTSRKYREHFPEKVNAMFNNINRQFITEDFIYSLMDVLDVRFSDNDDVQKYSFLKDTNE